MPRRQREDGLRLGSWVHNARTGYRQGRLTAEQISALARLPGWAWQVQPTPAVYDLESMVRLVRQFAERQGHARVPSGHRIRGVRLGAWVMRRRHDYKRGRLHPSAIRVLERVPGWTWETAPTPRRKPFAAMVRLLQRYARREGHGRVPQLHLEQGVPLGRWVASQRRAYRQHRLRASRIALLESIPRWTWRVVHVRRVPLERVLSALHRFVKREGHARVPAAHVEADVPLGQWVNGRRVAYARGRLSPALVRRLGRYAGWTWDPRGVDFERMLELLSRYARREGHAQVPLDHVEAGARLGRWVADRRQLYKRGALAPAQVAGLQALPGWAWVVQPRHAPTDTMLAAFRRFVRRESHGRVPHRHREDGLRLGAWVETRRAAHRRGGLAKSAIGRLERTKGWSWSARRDRFDRMVTLLRRYVKREGDARVPPGHMENGERLGRWVAGRRRAYRLGRLTREDVRLLEQLPGWPWNTTRGTSARPARVSTQGPAYQG